MDVPAETVSSSVPSYGFAEHSSDAARLTLVRRLRERQDELVRELFVRVHEGVRDPLGGSDVEYVAALHETVEAVFDYVLGRIEQGGDWSEPVPTVVLEQARRAARAGVALETVLRRYVAGHALLGDTLMAEAQMLPREVLRELLAQQSSILGRVLVEVSRAHERELERARRSPSWHRAELARLLLAGEPLDPTGLGYPLEAWHLGVIASGGDAHAALGRLGAVIHLRLLCVAEEERVVWGWFADRRPIERGMIERHADGGLIGRTVLAVGETAFGAAGWRLTHRQAQAALSVARFSGRALTYYADVALLASALRDPVGVRQVVEVYMRGIVGQDSASQTLRATLRAYLSADRNLTAAAASLGVDRRTVSYRLRTVQERVGYMLHARMAELELALRLHELLESAEHTQTIIGQVGVTEGDKPDTLV